jgi:phosphoribosylglycinamide formyltransferase-1
MKNIAIFASGAGTNAENIARLFNAGNRVRVVVALTNKEGAGVVERMEALNVPTFYFPNSVWAKEPEKIVAQLEPYHIDLVVLAGFMRRVADPILEAYPSRVVNIHPSLLPRHGGKGMYGHYVHEAVVAAGDTKTGVTVHYVTNEIDGGKIIMQEEVEVAPTDTAESVEAKIHPIEYSLYPRAIVKALAELDTPTDIGPAAPAGKTQEPSASEANAQEEKAVSVDEEWADALSIKYSDSEAQARKESLEAKTQQASPATPPPHTAATPPAYNSNTSAYNSTNTTARTATTTARYRVVNTAATPPAAPIPACPKSYLWVSILMAVVFSTLPGIVAVVFSVLVGSRHSMGDYEGARKASNCAQGWIIASFVIGVLSTSLYLPLSILSASLTI